MGKQEVSRKDLIYAKYQAKEAENRLLSVKERAYMSDDNVEPEDLSVTDLNVFALEFDAPNLILDLQLCIELSVKSMFVAVGVDHPRKHSVSFEDDRTEGLLANIPSPFDEDWNVPRAIFLTQLWHKFYELTKYGVPEYGISPAELMSREDAEKAIDDAEYCVELANELVEHQESEQGWELDTGDYKWNFS